MDRIEAWEVGEWVGALARRDPAPAGGALALVTLSGAAALAAKVARLRGRGPGSWERLAGAFLGEAGRDGTLYGLAVRGGPEDVRASLEASLDALARAVGFVEDLAPLFEGLPEALAADVAAAERLARAAAETLSLNLAVNLSAWEGRGAGLGGLAARWQGLRSRLGEA